MAVTVSLPTGALAEVHEPVPSLSVALHNDVVPTVNATVPVGVPVDPVVVSVTVAA